MEAAYSQNMGDSSILVQLPYIAVHAALIPETHCLKNPPVLLLIKKCKGLLDKSAEHNELGLKSRTLS